MKPTLQFLSHTAFLIVVFAVTVTGQVPRVPPVEEIIAKAVVQRGRYIDEFKDLLSRETKTFRMFDKSGSVRSSREIVSTFIVYQSPANGRIGEFRNVISVDGRAVENADRRAEEFFTEIAAGSNSAREWERIEKEGSRFDDPLFINGLTLFQAVVLADNIRPSFRFIVSGTEELDGRGVYVVTYDQTRDTRYISMDPKQMANDGKPELVFDIDLPDNAVARVTGKFWIDRETFQVRKEDRRVSIQNGAGSTPVIAVETQLDYHNSPFAILTPKRIVFTQFRRPKGRQPARKETEILFNYDSFTKPDVEVKGTVKT